MTPIWKLGIAAQHRALSVSESERSSYICGPARWLDLDGQVKARLVLPYSFTRTLGTYQWAWCQFHRQRPE